MRDTFRTKLIEAYRLGTSHAKYPQKPSYPAIKHTDTASIYEEVIRKYEG